MEIQHTFITGDHWLYYKIYTGPKTVDIVLEEIIGPVAERLLQEGVIDKWFFIRYTDPKHHLRIRFHCPDTQQLQRVIGLLFPPLKKFVDLDLIWKIQTDSYQREIGRYGNTTMELSETLFFYDSKMITHLVSMIEGDEGEELRWLFSLKAMASFLDCFQYSDASKLDLLNILSTGYKSEFDSTKGLSKQLSDKYRGVREKIDSYMNRPEDQNEEYSILYVIIEEKAAGIKPIVSEVLRLYREKKATVPLNDWIASHLHMLMNRLFKSNNRLHEAVCYDFLSRYYKSKIAREKTSVKQKVMLQTDHKH